uniref:Transmembrane protein n=1 Tax=Syphacia muris TaxID=451379 RepID=A0A0N5AZ11_9BILA
MKGEEHALDEQRLQRPERCKVECKVYPEICFWKVLKEVGKEDIGEEKFWLGSLPPSPLIVLFECQSLSALSLVAELKSDRSSKYLYSGYMSGLKKLLHSNKTLFDACPNSVKSSYDLSGISLIGFTFGLYVLATASQS